MTGTSFDLLLYAAAFAAVVTYKIVIWRRLDQLDEDSDEDRLDRLRRSAKLTWALLIFVVLAGIGRTLLG